MSKKIDLILVVISCLVVFGISAGKRLHQYSVWKKNKSVYFVDKYPAVTTLDAYYWLRYAEIDKGLKKKPLYDLRNYPDIKKFSSKNIPILSKLISKTCDFFNNDGYNKVFVGGIKLIDWVAGLFTIPFIIYLYLSGAGFSGVLGGLIGSFSTAYYVRSFTGRVDTDAFVLMGPVFIALFLLLTVISERKFLKYIFSAVSGLFFLILCKFHGSILVGYIGYLFLLIFLLFLNKVEKKEILKIAIIFILFSNPLNLISGLKAFWGFLGSSYVLNFSKGSTVGNEKAIVLPNIIQTITETIRMKPGQVLDMMFGNRFFAVLGLIGSAVYFILNFRKSLFLLPMAGLGFLAFFTSNRFAMFLAPFIGVGIGYLFHLLLKFIYKFLKNFSYSRSIIEVVFGLIFFFSFAKATGFYLIPSPSIPAPIVKSFIDMKHKFPLHSAIFTWWDFGYALMDIGDFYTYHDGGIHGGVRTYFVAKGLTINSQEKLYNLISYLEDFGFKKIKKIIEDNKSPSFLLHEVFDYKNGKIPLNHHIYILYTQDMIPKYGAISYFGNWNFKTKKSSPDYYQILSCYKFQNEKLYCSGINVNLKDGVLELEGNRKVNLKQIIMVNNGYIFSKKTYPYKSNLFVEILMKNRQIFQVLLLNKRLFESNFNQQFILGNIDRRYFREAYNNFPFARAFEVLHK